MSERASVVVPNVGLSARTIRALINAVDLSTNPFMFGDGDPVVDG